ncbi:MAG: PilZ domain-containing protein [Leptospirillia bacterium]
MGQRPRKPKTTPETREKRYDIRVGVPVAIRASASCVISGRTVYGWVRNLSRGGLFMTTNETFAMETELDIDALTRDGDKVSRLRLRAWVAFEGEGVGDAEGERGMGLQFGEMAPEMAAHINELLIRFSRENQLN